MEWRSPRRGTINPQRLTNPVWEWLARSRLSAYQANAQFGGPSSFGSEPGWCNQRFGQSVTDLPDGRSFAVGGEHEDHYDPDFYIYNDVIVTAPDGTLEIYGYPEQAFPPTDFHTATLVDHRLLLVGCLGYPAQRRPATTPVHILDVNTLRIEPVACSGDPPGWLFGHEAELSEESIIVRGGQRDDGETLLDNGDEWSLDLTTLAWTRLTNRGWEQWELGRKNGQANDLFTIWQMAFWHNTSLGAGTTSFARKQLAEGEQTLGRTPDFALYSERFRPPLCHSLLPERENDNVGVYRIEVGGVIVRYVESSFSVKVTIEGRLPENTVATIIEDARAKLERLEQTPYVERRRS